MRRRGFLAALLAAPAAAWAALRPKPPLLLGLSRASYPVLRSNVWVSPRPLTEADMIRCAEAWAARRLRAGWRP